MKWVWAKLSSIVPVKITAHPKTPQSGRNWLSVARDDRLQPETSPLIQGPALDKLKASVSVIINRLITKFFGKYQVGFIEPMETMGRSSDHGFSKWVFSLSLQLP